MKAVAAVGKSSSHSSSRRWACVAALASAAASCASFAVPIEGPQLEISTAALPHFDAASGPARSSRMDFTLMPEQKSRSSIGIAFGVTSVATPPGAFGAGAVPLPLVDFGVHWRYTFDSSYRFDVTAYRRVPNADAISLIESHDPSYGARIEMGFGSRTAAKGKGFVADRGFVGFQLEGGGRVTFKRTGGVPMLYYRNTFY
jgi:hypothetical protein